jgi:hypothetical protein
LEDKIRIDLRGNGWGKSGLNASGSGQEPMEDFFEHSNESSGFIEDG